MKESNENAGRETEFSVQGYIISWGKTFVGDVEIRNNLRLCSGFLRLSGKQYLVKREYRERRVELFEMAQTFTADVTGMENYPVFTLLHPFCISGTCSACIDLRGFPGSDLGPDGRMALPQR